MNLPTPEERPLLRPTDLLEVIPGLKRSAVYAAIGRGDLPSVRIGSRIYIPTAAVRRLFQLDPTNSEGAPASAPLATTCSPVTTTLKRAQYAPAHPAA